MRFLLRSFLALAATWAALAAHAQSAAPEMKPGKAIPYRLTVGDIVSVQVYGEQLGVKDRVDAQGNIHCQLIGAVSVYNDTLAQAEKAIEAAYVTQQILAHPQVSVVIEEYAEREVSVEGQVKQPRRYPLPPDRAVTLADMIMQAGGFTDVANGNDVTVTRIQPNGAPAVVQHIAVKDFLKGKLKDKAKLDQAQLVLQPGDVIYVPERII